VPFILGTFYRLLYTWYTRRRNTLIDVVGFSFIFLFLGIWIAGGPISLFNEGSFAIALFLFSLDVLIKFTFKKKVEKI
jgi:hypothetical protein